MKNSQVTIFLHTNGQYSLGEGIADKNQTNMQDVEEMRYRFLWVHVKSRVEESLAAWHGTETAQMVLKTLFEYKNVFNIKNQ